jgi:4-amino-4-deoxy-L-arabinose transferase-like glycosyltransferase
MSSFHPWLKNVWVHHRVEILLFAAAVALYLPGIHWGLPQATSAERVKLWAYDDISPLPALTEVYHTFVRSAPDRWLAYPPLHHFLLGAAYAPYLGWLALTGQLSAPSPVFPYGLQDPVTAFRMLTVIARIVSILMAAGIVVAVYRAGLTLWDRKVGTLSALAVLVAYPMFYYSKTACLEIPYVFWASLALPVYARILTLGFSVKRAAVLGCFAALAVAAKDQAAGLFLLLPLALGVIHVRHWRAGRVSWWGPPSALLGAGGILYAFGSGLVFDPERYFAHVRWITRPGGMLSEEFVSWYPETLWYPETFAGTLALVGAVMQAQVKFVGPILAAFAVVAILEAARRDPAKLWMALPAVSYIATFIIPIHWFCLRYGMPVMLIVALFAGRGLALALRRAKIRPLAALLGVVALGWPAFSSLDLVRHLFTDTRLEAERWLAAHMAPGDRIAALHHVNALPRIGPDVQVVAAPTGAAALTFLNAEKPEFLTVIPDWTSIPGTVWSKAYPEDLRQALEDYSLGYNLAATFDSGFWPSRPLLDYPAVSPPVRIYRRVAPGGAE